MSKRLLYALIIIALAVIVLIFNMQKIEVNLLFTQIDNALASIVFLIFIGIGVVIGILLK